MHAGEQSTQNPQLHSGTGQHNSVHIVMTDKIVDLPYSPTFVTRITLAALFCSL